MSNANLHITARTIYGSLMQSNLTLGLPHAPLPLTTLNEKFNVHKNTSWPVATMPRIEYYCIGNGGHKIQTGADGIGFFEPVPHKIRDAGLYRFMPFVIRDINNDLSATDRARYGMRTLIQVEGVNKWAYYLKRIELGSVQPVLTRTVITNGVATVFPFTPDSDDLSPTPPIISPNGSTSTDGEFISVMSVIDLSFTPNDVQELINVARVLWNNELLAAISEIGLVGAVKRNVSLLDVNGVATPNNYAEALGSVIVSHTTAYYPVGMSNEGTNLRVKVGANEPMFGPAETGTSAP